MNYYGNQNPAADVQPVRGVAERELWQAVVMQALMDATHELDTNTSMATKAEKHKAITWIKAGGDDFREVLTLAGMDHEFVRESFLAGRINGDLLRGIGPQRVSKIKRQDEILTYLAEPRTAGEVARQVELLGPGQARDIIRVLARNGLVKPAGQKDYVQMWQATGKTPTPRKAKPRPVKQQTQGRRIKWTEPMEATMAQMRDKGASWAQIADQLELTFGIKAPTHNAIKVRLTNMRKRKALEAAS